MGDLAVYSTRRRPHYQRHLDPIVAELERRGHEVHPLERAKRTGWPILVASWVDARRFAPEPVIYVEHGAGQSYVDGPPEGYAGAPGLDHVRLFLTPGAPTAERWADRYPQAVVEAVGNAALDRHVGRESWGGRTVVVTCHWRCGVNSETMPALDRYLPAVGKLRHPVIGHAHPRIARRMAEAWERLGIEFDPDPDSVLRRADVLVADNTSLLYEAAALDVPVVCLNDPSYRRDVHHGLRFWNYVPGIQCNQPADLARAVGRALADNAQLRALRHRAVEHVYAAVDGHAAERAADAIGALL